jgi:hypothetical protein
LIITLGKAKYRAAPRTSPWRRASDHALITLTAAGAAETPVGPGVGRGWLGLTSGAGVAGEVTVRRVACAEVCTIELPEPHPAATDAIVKTAANEAG